MFYHWTYSQALVRDVRNTCPLRCLVDEKRSITCVTFDEPGKTLATNGIWVQNNNVRVVDHPGVCKHNKCGYFAGNATLEIPFFVNHYQDYKQFSVSLFYGLTAGASYQVRTDVKARLYGRFVALLVGRHPIDVQLTYVVV